MICSKDVWGAPWGQDEKLARVQKTKEPVGCCRVNRMQDIRPPEN